MEGSQVIAILTIGSLANPYYSTAAPMKLYDEEDVLPFKSQEKIENNRELSERMKKVRKETIEKEDEARAYIEYSRTGRVVLSHGTLNLLES